MCHARMAHAVRLCRIDHKTFCDILTVWLKNRPSAPTKPMIKPVQSTNGLLDAFEPASQRFFDPHIQPVTLVLGQDDFVCGAGGFLEYVYFPKGAVLRC